MVQLMPEENKLIDEINIIKQEMKKEQVFSKKWMKLLKKLSPKETELNKYREYKRLLFGDVNQW